MVRSDAQRIGAENRRHEGLLGEHIPGHERSRSQPSVRGPGERCFRRPDRIWSDRMHNESGLKTEDMKAFWESIFRVMKEAAPNLQYEVRAKGVSDDLIEYGPIGCTTNRG